jgi:putative oxidoreductase
MAWAILPIRLALGAIFIGHGAQKVFGVWGGSGIQGFSQMLAGLGFSPVSFWAYLEAYVELLGGICLLLGAFSRTAATLVFILIVVAIYKVHFKNGFFLAQGGYEYNLLILAACLAVMIAGGGALALTKKF